MSQAAGDGRGAPSEEAELRALLALTARAGNVSVFRHDLELRYTWALDPDPGERTTESVLGKRDDEVLDDPAEAQRVMAAKRRVLSTGRPETLTAAGGDPSGRRHEILLEPLRDGTGAVVGLMGADKGPTGDDERRWSLEQGDRRAGVSLGQRFEELLSQTAVHIYVKDLDGRYTIASQALREHIGDAVGKTDFDLVPRWVAERWRANDQMVIDTRTPLEVEEQGAERTFLAVKVPLLDGDGRPYGVFGCSSDITSYKRMTEQLFSTQRLESLGQLASGVAHDFNNLLSVIGAFTSYLLEADIGERGRSDLEAIQRAVDRGSQLTRQLLLFSGRRSAEEPHPVSIPDALENVERLLARTLSHQIDLEVRRGAASLSVSAEAGHIEQIVTNLALNARDAMPDGGRLLISADAASTSELEDAGGGLDTSRGHVRMLVRDTGMGMGPAEAARAMEPFFTTKEPGEGTGLGLATVYGIAKQLGGAVTIDSVKEAGTSVYVWLPSAGKEAETGPAPQRAPIPAGVIAPVILLVEDEDDVREGTARMLSRGGYSVIPVASGEECLRVLEASDAEIDIALLDVVLPDVSGLELADRIGELAPHVAIVHMSGSASSSWPLPLIEKPFSPDRLLRELDQALRRGHKLAS